MQEDNKLYGQGDTDRQFRILKHVMAVAATPLFPDSGSRAYRVYQVIVAACAHLMLVTAVIDITKKLDDMDFVAETARPCFPMINVLWIHFFIRYSNLRKCNSHCLIKTSGFAVTCSLREMNV